MHGRSRGGYGTKACLIAAALEGGISLRIAPGEAYKLPDAIPLLDTLPGGLSWVVADRGFSSHSFCEHIASVAAKPAVLAKSNEVPVPCSKWIYNDRNGFEGIWAKF